MKIYKIINMIASGLVMAIIFVFMIGEQFTIWTFNYQEMILSIFFPIGLIIGLSIGFFKERIGGYIAAFSFVGFYISHLVFAGYFPQGYYIFLFSIPGFSLLFYALMVDYFRSKRT